MSQSLLSSTMHPTLRTIKSILGDTLDYHPSFFKKDTSEKGRTARAARFIRRWYGMEYPEIFGMTQKEADHVFGHSSFTSAGGPKDLEGGGLKAGRASHPDFVDGALKILKSEFKEDQRQFILETFDLEK